MLPFHFHIRTFSRRLPSSFLPGFPAFSLQSSSLATIVFLVFLSNWMPGRIYAGASSSQWVIAVNGDSVSSRTVANHFCTIRDIPANNIIVLEGIPDTDRISLDQFRESILAPILAQIEQRGLGNHVQGIAYSVDFPTSIDVSSDAHSIPNLSPYQTPVASINGLTYLYRHVLAKSGGYLAFDANFYASRPGNAILRPILSDNEKMEAYIAKLQAKDWKSAAEWLESATESTPRELRAPNHLLAAKNWASADETEKALASIEAAVLSGWQFRDAIANAPDFSKLAQERIFQRLLKLCPDMPFDYSPSRGFDARRLYAINGMETKDPKFGIPFMLSTVLGVTRDLGISRFDVIKALQRSAKADYSPADGAFLFTKTSDVRTTTRLPFFEMTVERLKKRGFDARIVDGVMPTPGEKCAGLMIGTPEFSVPSSGIEIMPGAIAENLTSLGGAMRDPSQTKATELIRGGAAITSGAVFEPYSITNKFPHPMIHVAYTDGLTSAEAFYSSVLSPYQLLIVGDPLCQPYAKPPRFTLANPPKQCRKDKPIALEFVVSADSIVPENILVTLDGRFLNEVLFEDKLSIQFSSISIGYHELRIITKSSQPIQHCYEQTYPFVVNAESTSLESVSLYRWKSNEKIRCSQTKSLEFGVVGFDLEKPIEVWHESEIIDTVTDTAKGIAISPSKVGYGPVRLRLVQQLVDGRIATESRTILVEP
ncbi:MAG: hypothetical protein ACK56W_24575 [Pirellula sp.]|jgi:hypothetical protein|nr:hypothetical protein [Pirellula sp.]